MKNLTLFHDVEKLEIYLTHLFRVFADKEIFFKNVEMALNSIFYNM